MPSQTDPRSVAPERRPWRTILLWGAFGAVLITGIVLAARHGASAPALLEAVAR
jgi:hypothetical protein